MNSKIIRTESSHEDFVKLVRQLDHYLAIIDGDEHDFYHQYNQIENLDTVGSHCFLECLILQNNKINSMDGILKLMNLQVKN